MFQVGTIVHRAKSGRLIVRLSREAKPGAFLFDDARRKVGRVVELMGPVKAPYASVALATSKVGKAGSPVFTEG